MNPYQPPQKKTLSKISIVNPSTQEQVTTPTTTPTSSRPTSKGFLLFHEPKTLL